ncbi:tyrosine-protein kinase receptor torso-like isoform X2 [Rhodnius prolixus]|uniref:tyrosine-protein kinase receptor torso-like isoform X2 n=1 Tax=Rhodnius prolixus TaxID=13249 RepID=UPI003D18D297
MVRLLSFIITIFFINDGRSVNESNCNNKEFFDYTLHKQDCITCSANNESLVYSEEDNLLLCRGTNFLTINLNQVFNNAVINCTAYIYICTEGNNWTLREELKVEEVIFKIEYLLEGTNHKIVITDNVDGTDVVNEIFRTLNDDLSISAVQYSNLSDFVSNGSTLNATFVWTPVKERVCEYEVIIWDQDSFPRRRNYSVLKNKYVIEFGELKYSTQYHIEVKAIFGAEESKSYSLSRVTPSCFDMNGYNYTICVPEKPANLQIIPGDCEILASWDSPPTSPDNYILIMYYNNTPHNLTLLGNETSVLIPLNHFDFGQEYVLFISSVASSGNSEFAFSKQRNNYCNAEKSLFQEKTGIDITHIVLYVGIFAFVTINVIILTVYFKRKRHRNVNKLEIEEKKENMLQEEENAIMMGEECDEYEIPRNKLQLHEIIGEGEFGVVRRAHLKHGTESKDVAVKMLRDKATTEDKRQLVQEVKVMKSVGFHVNIVSLIGYCSTSMLLVVEYCSLGDLQNYLRKIWQNSVKAHDMIKNLNIHGTSLKNVNNAVSNILYENSELEKELLKITIVDLISLARQIATGMEYLSKNRVIHRDLAARNVLLTGNRSAKISDFGLSRDVYEQNMYRKKTTARLPIKWMALESLVHHLFTTQSDVWSFGILLWEIMTLGCCPYPSFQSADIYELLIQGYRMEKPLSCSNKLYELMLSCWDASPQQRPSFTKLVLKLEEIMEAESSHKYLQLIPISNYHCRSGLKSKYQLGIVNG